MIARVEPPLDLRAAPVDEDRPEEGRLPAWTIALRADAFGPRATADTLADEPPPTAPV